jgi:type II secretory pathway component GspD/PulD (secretin)
MVTDGQIFRWTIGRLRQRGLSLAVAVTALTALTTNIASGQDTTLVRQVNDSVVIRLVDTDLRAAIQALSRYMPKTVLTASIPAVRVTLEPPGAVSRLHVPGLLRGLVESNSLQMIEDSAFYRIEPKPQTAPQQGGQPDGQTGEQNILLFVIRLKHARASDVASTINLLFGGSGEFAGRPGLGSGTLSDELRRQQSAPEVQPDASKRRSALSGSITIVPDELTNSLLIRSSQVDFDVLTEAVNQLDIRPLQVLIEVLIVEARHDSRFSMGTDIFVPPRRLGDGTVDARSNSGGGVGDLVIRLMNLGKGDIDATIGLAQSRGDVEILSRPVLIASNNTEARFLVGTQRPFVQISRTLPDESASRDQVVQYRDVGTKLTVRPTINQDGYVSLILQQEINAATSETQFNAPVISTREASTQVLVRDGQTIMIGGLKDRQRDRSRSGVPILSSIPLIGGLFGSTSRASVETELYIFITPRIIRTDEEADAVTAPRLPDHE